MFHLLNKLDRVLKLSECEAFGLYILGLIDELSPKYFAPTLDFDVARHSQFPIPNSPKAMNYYPQGFIHAIAALMIPGYALLSCTSSYAK
ncbi:MAG: hypothetical protein F6K14_24130 [Symploca sp. SIO2C1]|nr:hypothetical protein [Symploca sp. SIO2C1]